MQNTDQTGSPPSLNPENQPETPKPGEAESEALAEVRREDAAEANAEADAEAEAEDAADGEPFTDEQEEARFIEIHGGPSGRLRTPEEAAEERAKALAEVKYQIGLALQAFRKITKQGHTVDRLLGNLTPTASMVDRLPFTPSPSLQFQSRNRDDHILHLAGLAIETWGILVRDDVPGMTGQDGLDNLKGLVTRLGDVIHNLNLFKVYPVEPRSALFTLRLITDQAELKKAAEDQESRRASRLSGDAEGEFPRRTD